MSVTLEPVNRAVDNVDMSIYSWRCVVDFLIFFYILDRSVAQPLHVPMSGSGLNSDQCLVAAEGLEQKVISRLSDTNWIYVNGEITEDLGDLTLKRPEDPDHYKNYFINKEMLVTFVEFCKQSNGFEVL